MSVTGVNNTLRDLLATRIDQTIGRPLTPQSQTGGTAPAGPSTPSPTATTTATKSALTPQGAAGLPIPALWSILTGEERAPTSPTTRRMVRSLIRRS